MPVFIPMTRPQRRKEIVYHLQNPIKGLSDEERKELFWPLVCIGVLFLIVFVFVFRIES
jgi:hypothetical protein